MCEQAVSGLDETEAVFTDLFAGIDVFLLYGSRLIVQPVNYIEQRIVDRGCFDIFYCFSAYAVHAFKSPRQIDCRRTGGVQIFALPAVLGIEIVG